VAHKTAAEKCSQITAARETQLSLRLTTVNKVQWRSMQKKFQRQTKTNQLSMKTLITITKYACHVTTESQICHTILHENMTVMPATFVLSTSSSHSKADTSAHET